jgi:AcrR family transcriptional regulator
LPPALRREAIVEAAAPLVRRHGRAVTTGQIAAAAGVSEGTLFHVFADKAAIIDAVVVHEMRTDAVVVELNAVDPSLELPARIAAVVEVLRRRLGSVFELMTAVGLHRPPESARGPHATEAHAVLLRVVAEQLRPDASALTYSPEETARLIRLFTFAATHPAITDNQPLSTERIAAVLTCGVLRREGDNGC